ncbi:LysR substrate-binding domain-containing protein [Pararoseomonas sp. SCSIO 73927]|uniref:LysR substrate-binding domain-containing protein n=1 Tax=Pararoseomonas sp. SCSIO 73927 TaxID=3114537 RepID=UPI0030D2284A
MNDAQLRCFHVAAAEGSFTRAAVRLNVSQPTISAQIAALEKGYGVKLFRRVGRSIELTELGGQLHSITGRLYAAQDEARALLGNQRKLVGGHLRIGAVAPFHVMPILQKLKNIHPEVTFSLRFGNSTAIHRAMLRYEIDIGVLANIKVGDARLHVQFLRRDEIVLLMKHDHALAHRARVTYQDLQNETLIIREEGSTTRSTFLDAAAAADHPLTRFVEMESREAAKEAVACGIGIAPVLRSEAGQDQRCRIVSIVAPAPHFDEFVACPADLQRMPVVRSFLEIAAVVAAELAVPEGPRVRRLNAAAP